MHGREARVCVCARVYAEDGLVGKRTRPLIYPSPLLPRRVGTPSAVDAFWPQVRHASPTAAHPSPPPPPGQHARVIGRVSVIPPNAAPSSMRLQECTDLRRLSVHQLQLQCTAKTPLTGSPRHPCVTPRSHGPLLPRRHREPQRPPTASCAMHCTPLVQDLQGHTLRTGRFLFGRICTQSRDRPHADRVASA